ASEASLNNFYRAGFDQMGVLAGGNTPERVCPFDKNRSGFAMGEGACVLFLESEESLKRRGHTPLARVCKTILQHGGEDIIKINPAGTSVCHLIRESLLGSEPPDYINAHGTGTRLNDLAEANGIRLAFEKNWREIPVSSTKGSTGHLLGAAGAVEAAFSVLALRDQVSPPTVNLEDPDPDCELNHVPKKSLMMKIDRSMSLSYGFGGQMGAVLFEKV
ncbi:MAG: hypothetical protein LHV69_11140, partial [Elusimicrobia bacterium]|nr:hypothetical protein [Candidatus Obscuribacterium magneticum]